MIVQWHQWHIDVEENEDAYRIHQRVSAELYGGTLQVDRGYLWWLDENVRAMGMVEYAANIHSVVAPCTLPSVIRKIDIGNGQRYSFELRCNPTYTEPQGYNTRSKRRSLTKSSDVRKWFDRCGSRCGFLVDGVDIWNYGPVTWKPPMQALCTVGRIDIDGTLKVVDVDIFALALLGGIGRSRAFGFGCLRLGEEAS